MNILTKLKKKVRTLWRSSITGRFVPKDYALDNPTTTTEEKIK